MSHKLYWKSRFSVVDIDQTTTTTGVLYIVISGRATLKLVLGAGSGSTTEIQ